MVAATYNNPGLARPTGMTAGAPTQEDMTMGRARAPTPRNVAAPGAPTGDARMGARPMFQFGANPSGTGPSQEDIFNYKASAPMAFAKGGKVEKHVNKSYKRYERGGIISK
jgi:hypothetical protein